MIHDILSNANKYPSLSADILKVLEAAKAYSPENYPGGKVELDGDNVFMKLASYATHAPEAAPAEAHRQYIDVMVMVEGTETIYVKDVNRLQKVTKDYDVTADVMLAEYDQDCSVIRMEPGNFVILYPQDAHVPGCHAETPCNVKKIIGKVRIR